MKFSIIVPVYNIEQYITQCIESILSQSYSNFELILVNDGSKDRSPTICDTYANQDRRVKVIHLTNGGVSIARNEGLDKASGDYVLFVDGDDYWGSNFLEELKDFLVSKKEPDFVFNNSNFLVMPKGRLIKHSCDLSEEEFNQIKGEDTLKYLFSYENYPWSVWRNIYKTCVIKENKIYFKHGITLGEDADWLFRFILCTKKNNLIDMPYYYYRVNRDGSAMNTQSYNNLSSYLSIIKDWYAYSDQFEDKKLSQMIKNKFSNNYVDYFKYIYSLPKEKREKLMDEIQKTKVLNWVTGSDKLSIKNDVENNGFDSVVKKLYIKHIFREKTKTVLKKLKLLDR